MSSNPLALLFRLAGRLSGLARAEEARDSWDALEWKRTITCEHGEYTRLVLTAL